MGLITFLLLGAFSLLYLDKAWEKKPEFAQKAVSFLKANMDTLAVAGMVYGILAALVAPIRTYFFSYMAIHLLANLLIFAMALPFGFEKIVEKYHDKLNQPLVEELRTFIGWITRHEKYVGMAGAVFTVLIFAIVFR